MLAKLQMQSLAHATTNYAPFQLGFYFGLSALLVLRQFGYINPLSLVSRVMSQLAITAQKVPPGQIQMPLVMATGRVFLLNMLSAVSPRGEFRFMLHDGCVIASVFKTILQHQEVGTINPVFVVVDFHPVHKSVLELLYIDSHGGQLQLLPPYFHQLNPDEQVWAYV